MLTRVLGIVSLATPFISVAFAAHGEFATAFAWLIIAFLFVVVGYLNMLVDDLVADRNLWRSRAESCWRDRRAEGINCL